MRLTTAQVTLFKSIEDSSEITIDSTVTVFVGQNEAGKTAFLQALHKARPVDEKIRYNVTEDYPRRKLNEYEKQRKNNPATITHLTYELEEHDIQAVNQAIGFNIIGKLTFSIGSKYDNTKTITLDVSEKLYIQHLLKTASLPSEINQKAATQGSIRALIDLLAASDLNTEASEFLASLQQKFGATPESWSLLNYYIWKNYLTSHTPKFLYFDDYYLLPGKINLLQLQQRNQVSEQNNLPLADSDKTALSLLRMAQVELKDLTDTTGYETIKAKLEGISNSITDKVFEYWTQNQELEVEFDIRQDPNDEPPYNTGSNLYIRIRNRRHRVTVPFSQRSKGFIWFFSFIIWFSSIQDEIGASSELILLLDEPGLSLHGLAQKDFLRFIDDLAKNQQILYTTHSPFMVNSDRLHQVRTVEDSLKDGTKISDNVSGSDPKTLFPLQAALGYTLAQNLFISTKNLLVEGSADLIYLQFFSAMLEQEGRTALRDDITLVPVGGLDKLVTFIALLHGNELEIAVLHDYDSKPDPRLESLVREKLIRDKQVLHYGLFRTSVTKAKVKTPSFTSYVSTDVEDMMSLSLYLKVFNSTYKKELDTTELKEADLPPGDRIIDRINRYLKANSIVLRASGGFNHYRVASFLTSHPVSVKIIGAETLNRFEQLFSNINGLFSD